MEVTRILHIIGKMDRAGSETMVMNFYRKIDREKVQFDFLVFSEEEGAYEKEIRELGGNIYRLNPYKIYNKVSFRKSCREFFREHPYKVVHGHIRSSAAIYLKEAKKSGAYTVAHSHATKGNSSINNILYTMLTYNIRNVADYFFACSGQAGIDGFGKKVVNSDRFTVLKNAIDVSKYRYTKERHEKMKEKFGMSDDYVIGHIGRFAEVKNHRFIIDVYSEIVKREKKTKLVLVGEGELRPEIERCAEDRGLSERVVFLGTRDDVADILNLFDVFVFPSIYEGLGISLVEAQAAGLPCVVSDAIVEEAIVSGDVKKLSLKAPIEAWADELLKYKNGYERKDNTALVTECGFDIENEINKLLAVYEYGKNMKNMEEKEKTAKKC